MAEVKLPGDFITNFSDEQKHSVQKKGDFYSTRVIGIQKENNFEIIKKAVVPQIHDIIIGRVIRVKRKEAHLLILTTNGLPLKAPLLAELRSVDIAEKDVDNQIASKFCHPDDLIKARIVALGRSGFYAQVSTAEEGLGVWKLTDGKQEESLAL